MTLGLGICGCKCGSLPICGRVAVVVNGCNGKVIAGAPVKLFKRSVASVAVTNGGTGYTSPPTVVFATTNGRGATATAVLTGNVVTSITLLTGGVYTAAPVVSFTGGGGTGAAATATISSQSLVETINTNKDLTGFTFGTHGTNYTTVPNVSVTGGGGTGAVVTANLSAVAVSSVTLDSGGSGYTANPLAAVTGGGGSGTSVSPRLTPGPVTSLRLLGGSGYTNGSGYAIGFTGGGGTGAAGTFDVIGGRVCNLVLTNGGSGYTSAPTISFSGAGGSNATGFATFNLGTGAVTSVNLESGSGYTPGTGYALGFSGGVGGSGVAGTFDVDGNGKVTNLVLTNGGSGYTTNPTVSFPGAGGGTGATATALLGPTSVGNLVLALAGSGYTSTPTLAIDPPTSGTTATGHVTLASQNVASLTIVNGGRDFTGAPTVTIDAPGGGGTQATVTAIIATSQEAVFYLTEIGNYTVSVDGSANGAWWSTTPVTAVPVITSCSTLSSQTITLVPAAGKACACVQCRDPVENAAILTDANGSHTMTRSGSQWRVCYVAASASGVSNCTTKPPTTGIAVAYALNCPTTAGGTWNLGQTFACCDSTTDKVAFPSSCTGTGTVTDAVLTTACGTADNQGAGTSPNGCSTTLSFTMGAGAIVPGGVSVTL